MISELPAVGPRCKVGSRFGIRFVMARIHLADEPGCDVKLQRMLANLLESLYSLVVAVRLPVVVACFICPGVFWALKKLPGLQHLLSCMLGTAVVHNRGWVLDLVDRFTIVPTS